MKTRVFGSKATHHNVTRSETGSSDGPQGQSQIITKLRPAPFAKSFVNREAAEPPDRNGSIGRLAPSARYGVEQGTREIIPRDRVQCGRDQFIGFSLAASVRGLEPLGFTNIIDCKFTQTLEFNIVGNRVNRRQQIPGTCASTIISHADHERLLTCLLPLLECASQSAAPEPAITNARTWHYLC